jgi:type I restriction enzyme S subunit
MQYSIVNLSEVKANDFRLDAEYWLPEYLENEKLLKSNGIKIEECLKKENIKNIKNIKGDFDFEYLEISNTNACDYETNLIHSSEIPDRATYILKEKDICISTVRPNLNAVAFIKNHNKILVGTSGFCVLRCDEKIALSEFVYIFSKTKFFINSLIRENKATMYPAVSDFDIKKTYIPLLSHPFQTTIANLVQRAFELQQNSQKLYKEAETLLLQELGLLNWKPKHQLWYIKNYSDTVQANRLDAEYFQLMYEEIEKIILNYKNGYSYIKNEFNHIKDNIEIEATEEYDYVEIGSVSVSNGKLNH